MNKTVWSLTPFIALSACNITPEQGLQGLQAVGSLIIDINYNWQQESKRLCEQQNDPALRMRCEQQVNNEFQKYRHEQRKSKDE
jgi:hypothetical protein